MCQQYSHSHPLLTGVAVLASSRAGGGRGGVTVGRTSNNGIFGVINRTLMMNFSTAYKTPPSRLERSWDDPLVMITFVPIAREMQNDYTSNLEEGPLILFPPKTVALLGGWGDSLPSASQTIANILYRIISCFSTHFINCIAKHSTAFDGIPLQL